MTIRYTVYYLFWYGLFLLDSTTRKFYRICQTNKMFLSINLWGNTFIKSNDFGTYLSVSVPVGDEPSLDLKKPEVDIRPVKQQCFL